MNELAATLPAPVLIKVGGRTRWEHESKTPLELQVAKAVRLATSLRAALALADLRLTTEASSLLRMIGDINGEIGLLAEALVAGRLTKEQQDFLDQNFSYLPSTPEQLAAREPVRIVGRGTVAKARARLFRAPKAAVEEDARRVAYLHSGHDGYVHAKYSTAMELFNGRYFMLVGSESEAQVRSAKIAVAGKTVESVQSLRLMAKIRGLDKLRDDLRAAEVAVMKEHEEAVES
ncbi:MAG TPA: hypothetical protein VJX91_00455 [Candidatus Eisenbacteria bacterium]|nr:hypothetical protein [Candidatus Eisenbacteria bacterium]